MKLEIRESQIEDIFASQLNEVKNLLSINENITLVSRQKILPSGKKIDLLFLSPTNLLLVELKAVSSKLSFCNQVVEYRKELIQLQKNNHIPNLPIVTYLICTDFFDSHKKYCYDNEVIPIKYSPYEILKTYYFKVKAITKLIGLKPSNHGLWNLHLLNRLLYSINDGIKIEDLMGYTKLSKSTISSYLRLSNELGLTDKSQYIRLTQLGIEYVQNRNISAPVEDICDAQTEVLNDYIISNPFSSPAIYGIYTAVETIFALSKNFYPVPLSESVRYFKYLCGKKSEWNTKASNDAFIMYTNYSIDLGLLAKIGREYFITPRGIKFILLLELNKSILIVNSL